MDENKSQQCDGSKNYCWAYEQYLTGEFSGTKRGLCKIESFDLDIPSKPQLVLSLPALRYGAKKTETIVLNYCPFCGVAFHRNN